MKKLVILFLLPIIVFSSALETEIEIYRTIINEIFPNKEIVYIWIDDVKKKNIFKRIDTIKLIQNKKKADLLIVSKTYDLKIKNKKVFADGYPVYKHYKSCIIGGFYWQKGRPNLVFIKKNLQKNNISLSNNLSEYIEDSL